MAELHAKKGTVIWSPNLDAAYELTKDVYVGEVVEAPQFKGLGDTPDPKYGDLMPEYMAGFIDYGASAIS